MLIVVLVAGVSLYSYHENMKIAASGGSAVKSGKSKEVPLGDGNLQTDFVNVSSKLVITKNQNVLETSGFLVTANGTPVSGATIYLTCQTQFLTCGSGTSVTASNGSFVSAIPVQAACGEELLVQIGYQGNAIYAPYGQNYVAQSPCLTPG